MLVKHCQKIFLTLNLLLGWHFLFFNNTQSRTIQPLTASQGSLSVKSCICMMSMQSLRKPATGNNSNLQWIHLRRSFILRTQTTAPKFMTEHCLLFNKCEACLDGESANVGLWIKHVALIKNNLAQKCQRPLRSITAALLPIHSLHLTGFKEKGTWLAAATFRECIQMLYDPAVNVLSGIK